MSPIQHFQLYLVESIEEVSQPFHSYICNSLKIHFNKIKTSMWAGMIFTPLFHSIYCLSLRLKHEGINLIANSFKFLKNIEGTNINVPKMKNVLLCPKECLNKYKNMLQLALKKTPKDFYGSP